MKIVTAPSNLGLRPLHPGHVPGTWRAPEALLAAGLVEKLDPQEIVAMPRPSYSPNEQQGTRLLNGNTMRAFNLALADIVAELQAEGHFPLVIGGDCSILLGALAGSRRKGPISLVHIDGHSDFRHPGNYDPTKSLGAVAGMDLALATSRGEAIGTEWPDVDGPLVCDRDVIQLGERENRDEDFAWPDVNDTEICRIDVFEANRIGGDGVSARIGEFLGKRREISYWVHLDVDVLDQEIMPAVDSPGSPGIAPDDLVQVLKPLVAGSGCAGMTVTVFDPDLDPDGAYATTIVSILAQLPFPN